MQDVLAGRERVKHDREEVQEQIDSINTLPDLTKKRILVNEFPYAAIDYDPEDNYRKTGVDPSTDSLRELGRGIQDTGLQQPIALISHDFNGAQLQELLSKNQSELRNESAWQGKISIIFGNRRYLSIIHHTNKTHESAFIYPKEALSWVGTISLIENMDREDVPLFDEAVRVAEVTDIRFHGKASKFAKFSGRSAPDISRVYHIGKACGNNSDFKELVASTRYTTRVALANLAQSINSEKSDYRTKKINAQIKELLRFEGKVSDFTAKACQLKEYAKGESNILPDFSNKQESKLEATKTDSQPSSKDKLKNTEGVNVKQFQKQLERVIENLKNIEHNQITEELRSTFKDLKNSIDSKSV